MPSFAQWLPVGFSHENMKDCLVDFQAKNNWSVTNNSNASPALVDATGQENTPPLRAVPPIAARNLGAAPEDPEAAPVGFNPKAFEKKIEGGAVKEVKPAAARKAKSRSVKGIEDSVKKIPFKDQQILALHTFMKEKEIAQPVLEAIQKGADEGEDIDVLGNVKEMMELFQTKALTKDGINFRRNVAMAMAPTNPKKAKARL